MNTGSVLAQFTITLSNAVTEPVSVEWYTSDGTAKAGVDYAANKGTALFTPGQTEKKVEILVYGRAVGSEDRSFFVEMLPPTNAILGASIGECIIHVDTSGSVPVTQIIVPTGPKGDVGKSTYQSWLDIGNTGTEEDFIESLKPSAKEIADEVSPLIDVGNTVLTAEGTGSLSKPDSTTVKAIARRVAFAAPAKIATVALAAGDNTLRQSDLSGDAVSFARAGFMPRVLRSGALFSPDWRLNGDGTITLFAAQAGDLLYAVQYDFVSDVNTREAIQAITETSYYTKHKSFERGSNMLKSNRDALIWVGAPAGQGPYFVWDGAYPKNVPAGSTPSTSGGIGSGKWLDVGAASTRNMLSSPSDGAGDALVTVKQPAAGSRPRSLHDKLAEIVSLNDFATEGDGATDDTAAINAAIASLGTSGGSILVPKYVNGFERRYYVADWSKIVNPYGVQFIGEGAIVSPEAVGGLTQHNLYGNQFKISYGHEYLYRVYKRMELGQTVSGYGFGDSTMQGGNGEDPAYNTGTLIFDMFQAAGLNFNFVNKGVAGTSWYEMNAVPYITATTDIFFIKYGINDGGTPGTGDRLANLATAIRSKLAEIRSKPNGGVNTLSIVIIGPNSTNDTEHNRDAIWYEKQRGILLQAARDFQCAYFDTYGMMPDVKNGAGFIMDNPFNNGQGVHPMNTMQCWIWGSVINAFFSPYVTEKYRSNNFLNVPSSAGVPTSAVTLLNYKKGLSAYRATVAASWPFEGAVITFRSSDDVGIQRLVSFDKAGSKTLQRTWNTSANKWNSWTGTAVGLTPINGWLADVSTGVPEARITDEGLVTISAYLTSGPIATGTQILSGLPAHMMPAVERRFSQANNDGTITCVGVSPTGNIYLVGGNTKATGVHILMSYYAAQ